MPGPVMQPRYPENTPEWLQDLLNQVSINPVSTAVWSGGQAGEPLLKSIGKKLSDLLGAVFETNPGAAKAPGVPRKLTFSGLATDRRGGAMQMHPTPNNPNTGMVSTGVESAPFEVMPQQLDELINTGAVDLAQPPIGETDRIQRTLRQFLDEQMPAFKEEQFKRGIKKHVK